MYLSSEDISANLALIIEEENAIKRNQEYCRQKLESLGTYWGGDDRDAFLSLAIDYYTDSEILNAYLSYLNAALAAYKCILDKGNSVQSRIVNLGYLLT